MNINIKYLRAKGRMQTQSPMSQDSTKHCSFTRLYLLCIIYILAPKYKIVPSV